MNALELVTLTTYFLYLIIFVVTAITAIRRPTPTNVDIVSFFSVTTAIIVEPRIVPSPPPEWANDLVLVLAMALPYLLLRLIDDLAVVPRPVKRASEVGLALVVLSAIALRAEDVAAGILAYVAYFVAVSAYVGYAFVREARARRSVTRRRMQAAATGTFLLASTIVLAGLTTFVPVALQGLVSGLRQATSLGSGVAYFVAFAPPPFLWRAWQEPELRAFLSRAARLPRLPTTRDIVRELEAGAAASVGASAVIGLWDEDGRKLVYLRAAPSTETLEAESSEFIGGEAFAAQRPIFAANLERADPAGAETYRARGVGAAIAAPITTERRRLGVLVLYAPRAPVFAGPDIALVQLLADQAAVILESRALIDEAARVRAHEEATRLKEDFLSAAAHDLKTPLTTLVAQSQFLERKIARDPSAPVDAAGIGRIAREARRLNALVTELLDASRLEQGRLVGEREPVDLTEIAREVCGRNRRCELVESGPAIASCDRQRIAQVLENLVENAAKYSDPGPPIRVRVWTEGDEARVAVEDRGIGIPAADLPHVFDRFRRGSNVDDRRHAGMGLGLFICRGIVQQHDGRIWVESVVDRGSTFEVALPVAAGD